VVGSGQRTCVPYFSQACSHGCERRHGCEGSRTSGALTRTDEGERCQSRALHFPWPRALPASDLLAVLIKPPLQHPRRWGPGRMAEQGGQVRKGTAWRGLAWGRRTAARWRPSAR